MGSVLLAARIHGDYERVVGFELPGPLLERASTAVARFGKEIRQYLSTESIQDIEVKAGGFLQHDWSDADVAFVNASCFDEDLLNDLALKCAGLKEGALVVTLGEPLASQGHLELVLQRAVQSTAGPIQAFVHRRVAADVGGGGAAAGAAAAATAAGAASKARASTLSASGVSIRRRAVRRAAWCASS